jgi:ATP-dependent RNA helicase DDX19/DBP5
VLLSYKCILSSLPDRLILEWSKIRTRNVDFPVSVPRGSKLKEHIIIGTPGKVVDWGVKYRFFDLGKIIVFVLDEADVMIATQGHQDQSFRIQK